MDLRCIVCGSTDLEGPYGEVYFCNGCGRTVRPGETLEDIMRRAKAERERIRERSKKQTRG